MVSTDLRRTAAEGSWRREYRRMRSRVLRPCAGKWSYSDSLPFTGERKRSRLRRTSEKERIWKKVSSECAERATMERHGPLQCPQKSQIVQALTGIDQVFALVCRLQLSLRCLYPGLEDHAEVNERTDAHLDLISLSPRTRFERI